MTATALTAGKNRMIRRIAGTLGILALALVLALLSAWWVIFHAPRSLAISNGPWRMSAVTGSMDADLYTRAIVAVTGLFALNQSETIYFSAEESDTHQRLRARCSYAIEGKLRDARWWSVTAYADDNFLIPNPAQRFSYNMGNLNAGSGGSFRIIAAPTEQQGYWLPTGSGSGEFSLLLRLYNPSPELLANSAKVTLPSITQLGSCS
jgi:hypothetical protein